RAFVAQAEPMAHGKFAKHGQRHVGLDPRRARFPGLSSLRAPCSKAGNASGAAAGMSRRLGNIVGSSRMG
ncbi:MAG: hypothetical protein KC432_12570, partial [Thermomicrobiales bacterium]|nr:hypothetical protein [Thermomicrobiales bacterium]